MDELLQLGGIPQILTGTSAVILILILRALLNHIDRSRSHKRDDFASVTAMLQAHIDRVEADSKTRMDDYEAKIQEYEKRTIELHKEHLECEARSSALEGANKKLQHEITKVREEGVRLRLRIRDLERKLNIEPDSEDDPRD